MHRMVLGAPKGVAVDHIDGNGLNNTRENLRLATARENGVHKRKLKPTAGSGSRGMTRGVIARHDGTFEASPSINGRVHRLGRFGSEQEAADAVDRALVEIHGEWAFTNQEQRLVGVTYEEFVRQWRIGAR